MFHLSSSLNPYLFAQDLIYDCAFLQRVVFGNDFVPLFLHVQHEGVQRLLYVSHGTIVVVVVVVVVAVVIIIVAVAVVVGAGAVITTAAAVAVIVVAIVTTATAAGAASILVILVHMIQTIVVKTN